MRRTVITVAALAALMSGGNADATTYDPTEAMHALFLSKAAYCDASQISAWNCGTTCTSLGALTDITVSDNGQYDSQGYVAFSPVDGRIVVAFRGSSNIPNWIQDLTFGKVPYPNPKCSGCEVHHGFLEEWQSYSSQILSSVKNLVSKYPTAPILVTGHSLGAAVSILAALDILSTLGVNPARVSLYNFGEPRVGTPAFAAWASKQLYGGKQFRVTHKRDPVPHVPPEAFDFLHTPHELWYDNDGSTSWKDCADSAAAEDPNCSDGSIPIDIMNHLLYLGVCTECSCSSVAEAEAGAQVAQAIAAKAGGIAAPVAPIADRAQQIPGQKVRRLKAHADSAAAAFNEMLRKKLSAKP